jgi:hypothetical protein
LDGQRGETSCAVIKWGQYTALFFTVTELLHWHQSVWWPGFEAIFQIKAFHGRNGIRTGVVK